MSFNSTKKVLESLEIELLKELDYYTQDLVHQADYIYNKHFIELLTKNKFYIIIDLLNQNSYVYN